MVMTGAMLNFATSEESTLMLDPKTLEDFGAKMSALLANSPAKDIEKNAKAVMSGLLGQA